MQRIRQPFFALFKVCAKKSENNDVFGCRVGNSDVIF